MKVLPINEEAFDCITRNIRLENDEHDAEIDLDSTLIVCCSDELKRSYRSSWVIASVDSLKCTRRAIYIPNDGNDDKDTTVILTHTNIFNLNTRHVKSRTDYSIDIQIPDVSLEYEPKFATNIVISLVGSCQSVDTSIVDVSLRNYFRHAKYLHEGDLISVNMEKYAPEIILSVGSPRILYFKTVLIQGAECEMKKAFVDVQHGYLVDSENTTLRLESTVASFLPAVEREYSNLRNINEESNPFDVITDDCAEVTPSGFEKNFEQVAKAMAPFLVSTANQIKLKPVFLICGKSGTGKTTLISSIAKRYGLHYLEKNCILIQNSQPAQTESILTNIFANIPKCSPCILHFRNIEALCEDEFGNRDDRTVDNFVKMLKTMSTEPPAFIFCSTSRETKVSPSLQRLCLQTVRLNGSNECSRSAMMKWIVKRVGCRADRLDEIVRATTNFVYADFVQLACRATSIHVRNYDTYDSMTNAEMTTLSENDFHEAINDMNEAFSDAIGAPQIPNVTWDDVGGLTDLKEEILSSLFVQSSNRLQRSGLLLYGPPGTGKTLLAKAVATECKYNFLSVKGPELLNMYVGQSEKNVREVFARARESAPCIVFFDELDSLAPRRGQSGGSGSVMDRVVSQLLAEMDGIQKKTGVFVLAATNRPDLIDSALLRPGRLDKMLFVGKCDDATSKINIFKALTRKFKFAETINWEDVVRILPAQSVTGADLYGICSNAWLNAARRHIRSDHAQGTNREHVLVTFADVSEAVGKLKLDDLTSD